MPACTIIQKVAAQTTTLGPASLVVNCAASTAGSFLVLLAAAAMSASGSIGTPANWTAVTLPTNGNAAIRYNLFTYPNNPGGVTSVTLGTFSNVNAVVAFLLEVANVPASWPNGVDALALKSVDSASAASLSTSAQTPVLGNELWVGMLAALTGQTLTAAMVPAAGLGTWTQQSTATSTTGTTNVQALLETSQPGPSFPTGGQLQAGLTLGGALACAVVQLAVPSTSTVAILQAMESGTVGTLVSGGAGYGVGG